MSPAALTAMTLALELAHPNSPSTSTSPGGTAACEGLLASNPKRDPTRRPTALDLVRLRDIGYGGVPPDGKLLSVSPDRKRVALVITRADPSANTHCQALISLALSGGAHPAVLDAGGDYIFDTSEVRGNLTRSGAPASNVPRWSPRGDRLAYLKRLDGHTRVWLISADGRERRPLLDDGSDAIDLAWTKDGGGIVIWRAAKPPAPTSSTEDPDGGGFLYDQRFVPNNLNRPAETRGTLEYVTFDLARSVGRTATPQEQVLLEAPERRDLPDGTLLESAGENGEAMWTQKRDPVSLMSAVDLWARLPDGTTVRCDHEACRGALRGIEGLWLFGSRGIFMRREGWDYSRTALYQWRPGSAPRRLLSTEDVLAACEPLNRDLICLHERSLHPRAVVRVDTAVGTVRTIYDPNPEFKRLRLGTVRRLRWRNSQGLEAYGDLVLPTGRSAGERLPMVIVQYTSRGFLRGGTGDEYPIQLLADAGFAVLCVQRPPFFFESMPETRWRSWNDAEIVNTRDWHERRSLLDSLLRGVNLAVERGFADPERIGLTGLSDGATTVQFALVNAPGVFAAAAVSSSFMDVDTMRILGGTAWYDEIVRVGYPRLLSQDNKAWQSFSPAANATRMATPILMQLSDNEYLMSLEAFMKMREARAPVELHIFPGEFHVKWQPSHRLAIYQRNLAWFAFWLQPAQPPIAALKEQTARWNALRVLRDSSRLQASEATPALRR